MVTFFPMSTLGSITAEGSIDAQGLESSVNTRFGLNFFASLLYALKGDRTINKALPRGHFTSSLMIMTEAEDSSECWKYL